MAEQLSSAQVLGVVREFVPLLLAERDRLRSERDRLAAVVEGLCEPPFGAYAKWYQTGDAASSELLEAWDSKVVDARWTVQSLVP